MAISTRPIARLLSLSALVAVGLSLTTGTSSAEPTPAEQIAALQEQLEVATEEYNAATIALADKQAEADAANAELGEVQAQIEDLTDQIGDVAASVYKGNSMTSFSSFMTSDSPEDFLSQLNTLGAIGDHNNRTLDDLSTSQQQATALKTTSDQALAAAAQAEQLAAEQKTFIESQLPGLQQQLADAGLPTGAGGGSSNDHGDAITGPINPPTAEAGAAVDAALSQLGVMYKWGGESPDAGFDCSGLTKWAYGQAGISIPHQSGQQSGYGVAVPRDQIQAGDLVFYGSPIHHVALAINGSQIVHAPSEGNPVQVSSIDNGGGSYNTARRITGN